jgi:hypothetical protein
MKIIAVGLIALALSAAAAEAHHSGAMFDGQKIVNVNGTVRDFQWTNPHSWLQLVVLKDGGGTEEWSIELASPNVLSHRGWKPSTLKRGDKLTVAIHPLNSGALGGSFISATLANGTVIDTGSGSGAGAPEGRAP